jgi:cytochrome P450
MIEHEEKVTQEEKKEKIEDKNDAEKWKPLKKSLSNREILAQAFLFLIAGSETTASTMTFAGYLLAKNPDIQNKLYEEILKAFNEHVNKNLFYFYI